MLISVTRPSAPKYHGPIGKCIYCGSDGGADGLSKEHAVPFALDGSHVLRKASCKKCSNITRKIEEDNFKGIKSNFGVLRVHDNFQTRTPKERPYKAPVSVARKSGLVKGLVPIKDRPPLLILPEFREPGIHYGASAGVPSFKRLRLMSGDASAAQQKYGGVISVDYNFNLDAFVRLLAKIAHSMAVINYGIDGYEPFLPDVILGNRPDLHGRLIGQSAYFRPLHQLSPIPRKQQRHQIYFRRDVNLNLIAAGITLFSAYDTPTYCVIVGRPKKSFSGVLSERDPNQR
jgi:hypothetical protein